MENKDLIRFVPAGSELDVLKHKKKIDTKGLTGDEAKAFYEDLIKDDALLLQTRSSTRRGISVEQEKDNITVKRRCGKRNEEITFSSEGKETETESLDGDDVQFIDIKQEPDDSYSNTSSDLDNLDGKVALKSNSSTAFKRVHNRLLNCAQNGDLSDLKRLYRQEKDLDTDYQDQYGWTALMCAAVARHNDVLKYLLSIGANRFLLNNKGHTVLEICEEVGAIDSKIVINTYGRHSTEKKHVKKDQKFYCDVCKRDFKDCSLEEHKSSTVHLFNLRLEPKPDRYIIPETNRGFQLMKKSGWDGQKGLGPEGQGTKFPVKTTLKRDRLCIGSDITKKPKITHFGPKDVDAVKSVIKRSERVMSARTVAKREQKKREQKDKLWERNLRTYMNIDF